MSEARPSIEITYRDGKGYCLKDRNANLTLVIDAQCQPEIAKLLYRLDQWWAGILRPNRLAYRTAEFEETRRRKKAA